MLIPVARRRGPRRSSESSSVSASSSTPLNSAAEENPGTGSARFLSFVTVATCSRLPGGVYFDAACRSAGYQ